MHQTQHARAVRRICGGPLGVASPKSEAHLQKPCRRGTWRQMCLDRHRISSGPAGMEGAQTNGTSKWVEIGVHILECRNVHGTRSVPRLKKEQRQKALFDAMHRRGRARTPRKSVYSYSSLTSWIDRPQAEAANGSLRSARGSTSAATSEDQAATICQIYSVGAVGRVREDTPGTSQKRKSTI